MKRLALPLLASLAIAASAFAETPSGLIVLPDEIDLGHVAPGADVDTTVWLVNTTLQDIEIESCRPSCGCTSVAFTSATLAPGAARAVHYTISAPEKPDTHKWASIRFVPAWGEPVRHSAQLRTLAAGVDAPAPSSKDVPHVVIVPELGDHGEVVRDQSFDTSAWIVNTGPSSVRVREIKTGCGCTTTIGFEPTDVPPSSAMRVRLRVLPRKDAEAKTVELTALLDGNAPPLEGSFRMSVIPPVHVSTHLTGQAPVK